MLQKAAAAATCLLLTCLLIQLPLQSAANDEEASVLVDRHSLHSRTKQPHRNHLHQGQVRPTESTRVQANWLPIGPHPQQQQQQHHHHHYHHNHHHHSKTTRQLASDDNEIIAGQTELLSLFQHHATTTTTISPPERPEQPTTNHRNHLQVPQQTLPAIVVSSSDNSYVSASPTTDDYQDDNDNNNDDQDDEDADDDDDGDQNNYEKRADKDPADNKDDEQLQMIQQAARPHILAQYDSKTNTIIKTRESIAMGATFINYTIVTNLKACLVECWITDTCDTAIYQETPVDFKNHLPYFATSQLSGEEYRSLAELSRWKHAHLQHGSSTTSHPPGFFICYLFQCAKADGYKCQFSPHVHYFSASKRPLVVKRGEGRVPPAVGPRLRQQPSGGHHNPKRDHTGDSLAAKTQKSDAQVARSGANYRANVEDEQQLYDGEQELIKEPERPRPAERCAPTEFLCHSNARCVSWAERCRQCSGDPDCENEIESTKRMDGSRSAVDNEETGNEDEDDDEEEEEEEKEEEEEEEGDDEEEEEDEDDSDMNPRGQSTGVASGVGERASISAPLQQETRSSIEMVTSKRPLKQKHRQQIMKQVAPHFSRIISAQPNQVPGRWHDSRIASIKIDGQEDLYGKGGLNSAIIAIMIGIGATGVLVVIVGHKMKSIRKRLAQKSRRRSLVPDTNFLINTMPIPSSLLETFTAATATATAAAANNNNNNSDHSRFTLDFEACSS